MLYELANLVESILFYLLINHYRFSLNMNSFISRYFKTIFQNTQVLLHTPRDTPV